MRSILQITFRARRRADADRFVGQLHVERIDVGLGIDRERANPEFLAGADDAQRDFAAIGDQDFFEHRRLPVRVARPNVPLREPSGDSQRCLD